MLDYMLFLMICTLMQIAILRIWLDSVLFSQVQRRLRAGYQSEHWYARYLCKLLTCWQCCGVWVGWLVVAITVLCLPSAPFGIYNIPMVILSGLTVGVASDLFECFVLAYMPSNTDEV